MRASRSDRRTNINRRAGQSAGWAVADPRTELGRKRRVVLGIWKLETATVTWPHDDFFRIVQYSLCHFAPQNTYF
jgi:hypothetical protein